MSTAAVGRAGQVVVQHRERAGQLGPAGLQRRAEAKGWEASRKEAANRYHWISSQALELMSRP